MSTMWERMRKKPPGYPELKRLAKQYVIYELEPLYNDNSNDDEIYEISLFRIFFTE